MSGIQSIGRNLAMDGHTYHLTRSAPSALSGQAKIAVPDPADVVEILAENLANTKLDVQELQRIADTMGKKVRFNVNKELGRVIVKIVDPSTDKVLREIPSVDMQQLQARIKQTMGMLVDEKA